MKRIVHITSVHPRYDTRIFVKECTSIATVKEYEVYLIVADGKGDEIKNNVKIIDVGKPNNRIDRLFTASNRVYKKALQVNGDIFHFHDPELLLVGNKLIKKGKKVVFDSHEDVPLQILSKSYLNKILKVIISKLYAWYEKKSAAKYSYIITPTQYIKKKFLNFNANTEVIYNYPLLSEVYIDPTIAQADKSNEICYIGSITKVRGIIELIKSLEYVKTDVKLNLGGIFIEKDVENRVKNYKGWSKVNELGFLNRKEVKKVLKISKIGLVTLHPTINYKDALPVKLFEYMAAGIPVIASDITLWKEIVDNTQCGICVNPFKPMEIAEAIDYLLNNPEVAEKMGKNGKKAVLEKFNWSIEEERLLNIYKKILI